LLYPHLELKRPPISEAVGSQVLFVDVAPVFWMPGCYRIFRKPKNESSPKSLYMDMGGINPLMNSNEGLVSDIAGFVEAIC